MVKSKYQLLEEIIDSESTPIQIENVGQFISEDSHPRPPAWITNFFGNALGNNLALITSSAKGVFLVPIADGTRTANFIISFGSGRHLLKEGVVEERFGLKVALNSADRESFRSIDKTTLGSVPKHSREQMSRTVAPAEFGVDIEQDLVSSVTAKSNDPRLGKIVTGEDALSVSVSVNKDNIVEFLGLCLERYRSKNYKENFDWIDQIAEIRNSAVEDQLNARMIQRINRNDLTKIWMAVPEVINWAEISGFRYIRAKRGDLHDDLNLNDYLQEIDGGVLSFDDLKNHHIFAIAADRDDHVFRWSAFRCLYAEIDFNRKTYILTNGKWYEIAPGFTAEVQRDFADTADSDIELPDYTGGSELEYNTTAAESLDGACCMDQRLIVHGGGHNRIEFCDILTDDKKMIHVKKFGGSSVLSHLFSQGAVSGELFVSDGEFRAKLDNTLPRGYKVPNPRVTRPNASQYEIVFAIITGSVNPLDIPFFSKVSLRSARRRLVSYGYRVSKKKIQKVRRGFLSPLSSFRVEALRLLHFCSICAVKELDCRIPVISIAKTRCLESLCSLFSIDCRLPKLTVTIDVHFPRSNDPEPPNPH